jgi:signal transduction histidine kinase
MNCVVIIKDKSERSVVEEALEKIHPLVNVVSHGSLDTALKALTTVTEGIIVIDEGLGRKAVIKFYEKLKDYKKDLFVILLSQGKDNINSAQILPLWRLPKVENYPLFLSLMVENAARKVVFKDEEMGKAIQIKKAKEELQKTIDAISDPIFVHNREFRLLRSNKAFARLVSKSPRDIPGLYQYDLSCHELFTDKETVLDVMESGKSMSYESSYKGRDYFVTISPYTDNNDEIVGAVHVMKDVTEMKQIQNRFYSSEKLISIGQLVSGVAHEINNPLAGIMGYTQLLTMIIKEQKAQLYLKEIEQSVERCKDIVDNLLTFSRQKKHKKLLLNSLSEAVNKTLELRSYWLRSNNIQVNNCIDEIPIVRFDFQQIQQVILNIIVNAEEAIASSGMPGVITIENSVDDKWVDLHICNNGPPIPPDGLRKIFDPFFSTKDVGEGTGLGLSVAFGIVKAHNGEIEAYNHSQKGVCFTIKLPREED